MNKELKLLAVILEGGKLNQRILAKRLDVSLGTTNNMLQNLLDKDLISIKKISSRRVDYNLTDNGHKYYNKLYVKYITGCFDAVTDVRANVKKNLKRLVENGFEKFYIYGKEEELLRLTKMCFLEISRKYNVEYEVLEYNKELEYSSINSNSILVGWTTLNSDFKIRYINLLDTYYK